MSPKLPARFLNRQEAGQKLAAALAAYARERPIILALPRGGVPVAYEVARSLQAPLDVWVVRKLGLPWHPELGVGAVSEGGQVHVSQEVLRQVDLSRVELDELIKQKRAEVEERVRTFRGSYPRSGLRGRTVILVDDGIATGGTVRAALQSIRAEKPRRLILAVPVAPPALVKELERDTERVVVLLTPSDLRAVGLWYEDFREVSDDEVTRTLDRARAEAPRAAQVGG